MGHRHEESGWVRLVFAGVFTLAIWAGANEARGVNLPAARPPTQAGGIVAWGG